MKITKKWLAENRACGDGVAWFLAQKKREGDQVVESLITAEKLQWAHRGHFYKNGTPGKISNTTMGFFSK